MRKATQEEQWDHARDLRKHEPRPSDQKVPSPHPLDILRQPQRVVVTIEGEPPDVRDIQARLQRLFSALPIDVDFQSESGKTVLFLHPWAING